MRATDGPGPAGIPEAGAGGESRPGPAPTAAGAPEPTPWTRPMRLFTAAYLVLLALVTVPTTVHFSTSATMRAIIEKTPQARGLRPADLQQAADADAAVAVGVALFLGIVYLIVAGGALRGWRWAFWLSVILLALESLSALTGLNSIAHPGASPLPRASLVGNWILSLVGVALFVWLLVGLSRFGPWAVRWPKRR